MNRKIVPHTLTNAIKIYKFSNDEINLIDKYININASFLDILTFYKILEYNIKLFKKEFEVSYSDEVICFNHESHIDIETYINAHFINIISAARILIDSIERDSKYISGNDYFYNKHMTVLYEENFNYRLLYKMRNYAQHGHIPIKYEDGKCSLDINILLSEPHNDFKKFKHELDNIRTKMNGNGNIAFKITVQRYLLLVYEIYFSYLEWLRIYSSEIKKSVDLLIENIEDPVIFYKVDDNGMVHGFGKNYGLEEEIESSISVMINIINDLKNEIDNAWREYFAISV